MKKTAEYAADLRPAYRIAYDDGEVVEVKRAVWPIRYARSKAAGRDFTISRVDNGKPTAYRHARYRIQYCASCMGEIEAGNDPEYTPLYGPTGCDHPIHW